MNVYVVRHGEVNHNLRKVFSNVDEDLNATGVMQARNLRSDLKNIDYDVVFSSPLKRAKQTADIINVRNKNILFDDRLIERKIGDLSEISFDESKKEEYWNYFANTHFGTSEDIQSFFNRISEFLDELKEKDYKNVLIVTHSGVSKAFNAYFNGINDGKFSHKGLKNCEMKNYCLD